MARIMGSTASGRFPVAVGAYLMGQPLELDDGRHVWPEVLNGFETVFDWHSFCPQTVLGLDLLQASESPIHHVHDVTDALLSSVAHYLAAHSHVCGYVLMRDCSSGDDHSSSVELEKSGAADIFVRGLQKSNPLMPCEEYSRFRDLSVRESFVLRVFAYGDWLSLQDNGLTLHRLVGFYSRYKYLVMSRDVHAYRQIGHLLANSSDKNIVELANQLMRYLMRALIKPATRAGQVNALEHVRGYLKHNLQKDEKEELSRLIELYREGYVPFVVPMTLLQGHFRRHPNTYIGEQLFMHSPFARSGAEQLGAGSGICL